MATPLGVFELKYFFLARHASEAAAPVRHGDPRPDRGDDGGRRSRCACLKPAIRTRDELQEKLHWPKKIVTEIVPATEFYEAEDYHQQYLEKRGRSSCTVELAEAQV